MGPGSVSDAQHALAAYCEAVLMALSERGLRTRLTELEAEKSEQAAEEVAMQCGSRMGPTTVVEELRSLKVFCQPHSRQSR